MKICRSGQHEYDEKTSKGRGCPDCRRAHWLKDALKWQSNHPEKARERNKRWRAAHLEQNRKRCREYNRTHKLQVSEKSRKWWAANPEKLREKNHRRRAQIFGSGYERITKSDLDALLKFQDGRCPFCFEILDDSKHLDHVVPLSRGGSHSLSNVCWSCAPCNLSKCKSTGAEFRAKLLIWSKLCPSTR